MKYEGIRSILSHFLSHHRILSEKGELNDEYYLRKIEIKHSETMVNIIEKLLNFFETKNIKSFWSQIW